MPIFFSEYGCNEVKPRTFGEVSALYSSQMTGIFSGGLVYEYSEEPNEYGLLTINDDNTIDLKEDYVNLVDQYNKIDLRALTAADSAATGRNPVTCSGSLLTSNLTRRFDVPDRLPKIQAMIDSGVTGNFPSGVIQVTNTNEIAKVNSPDGSELTGLELRILPNDRSNLPGENTSGTNGNGGPGLKASTTSTGSSSSPTNAASSSKVNIAGIFGAIAIGMWIQF